MSNQVLVGMLQELRALALPRLGAAFEAAQERDVLTAWSGTDDPHNLSCWASSLRLHGFAVDQPIDNLYEHHGRECVWADAVIWATCPDTGGAVTLHPTSPRGEVNPGVWALPGHHTRTSFWGSAPKLIVKGRPAPTVSARERDIDRLRWDRLAVNTAHAALAALG
jgi:hypothetical protein